MTRRSMTTLSVLWAMVAALSLLLTPSEASAQDVPELCSGEVFQDGASAIQGTQIRTLSPTTGSSMPTH